MFTQGEIGKAAILVVVGCHMSPHTVPRALLENYSFSTDSYRKFDEESENLWWNFKFCKIQPFLAKNSQKISKK